MSIKDKLSKKLRIYVIGHNAACCHNWMELHGFLTKERRDPRVHLLLRTEDVQGIHESVDNEFVFLPDWRSGRSAQFLHTLWQAIPNVLGRLGRR